MFSDINTFSLRASQLLHRPSYDENALTRHSLYSLTRSEPERECPPTLPPPPKLLLFWSLSRGGCFICVALHVSLLFYGRVKDRYATSQTATNVKLIIIVIDRVTQYPAVFVVYERTTFLYSLICLPNLKI